MTTGTKLGPYEIVALIGKGGMGEVYRAHDPRLGRDVAIKVSKEQFSERFEREARAVAALNHPNICHLYDVGPNYLVMEYVEGENLKGPLPLDETVRIARQIVDALEAAHDKGIVHRDLKPANIKIKPDGMVKVLDFGLAKMPDAPPEDRATVTMGPTKDGMILGTPAYMSPEQARATPVDRRTDIWAFGAVLYEMLSGKPVFHGDSLADILVDVVKREPDWSVLPPSTPAPIEKLIGRCLVKDRKRRMQWIGDARIAIEDYLADPQADATAAVPAPTPGPSWRWIAATGALALALILSGVLLYRATRPAPPRPFVQLDLDIPAEMSLARTDGAGMLALSPDGARLALSLRGAGNQVRLYTRLLRQSEFTPLAGTENATFPFFSPDGEWIGFFADRKLKKISVEGGGAVALCDAPFGTGASWGDDGNIIAALGNTGGLFRVPSTGGTPAPVTKLNPGEITHRWPQVLPGSEAALFVSASTTNPFDDAAMEVVSLKTGERKTLQRGGISPHFLNTSDGAGYLVYLQHNTLFAAPFDPKRLTLAGVAAPLLQRVSSGDRAGGDFAFAQDGSFVYLAGREQLGWSIFWLDSAGKTETLHAPGGVYSTPRFSPDGKRLAFLANNGQGEDIWVEDLDRDTASRLTFFAGNNRWPVWTPDGENIVFQSTNPAAPGLYWIRSDGSGEAQRLTDGKLQELPYSFSPDGKRLAFTAKRNGGNFDVFTAPVEGDAGHPRLGKAEVFVGMPFNEAFPAFSPDGRWLAYASIESGRTEVYVRPFPGPGGRWQISNDGGRFPLWSRDRRELFFQNLDGTVMAVEYTATSGSFAAGKPRIWSEVPLKLNGNLSTYDLAPDGKRFAVMLANDEASGQKPTHLTFLLNFFDELRRRAPDGK